MKIQKDLAMAIACILGVFVALTALFVTMPVWLFAVVVTLTSVAFVATITEIVKARKASYDEETGKYTYRFPIRKFLVACLINLLVVVFVVLLIKRLFGFAILPFTGIIATLLAIALVKKNRILRNVTAIVLAILVIAIVGYSASQLVHSGVELNPGISAETTAPETTTPVEEGTEPTDKEPAETTPEETTPEVTTPEETTPEVTTPEETTPEVTVPEEEQPELKEEPEETETKTEPTEPEETVPVQPIVVKINAPETMVYGEPITLTLEGIKATDLKFGNEDFIAIDIISDTEVQITLVGIVNDAGEVEFVPAAGYITVTDSVSGVNVSIEIIE